MIARHFIACRLIIGLLLLLITSCATSSTPAASDPTPAPVTSPVTLLLWHGWSGTDLQVLNHLIDQFNQQYPGGRVVAQAVPLVSFSRDLRSAVSSGTGPQLALLPSSWVGGLADANVLLPLDDLIAPADQQALLPVTIGTAQLRDQAQHTHLYGLPLRFDTLALFYNKANIQEPPATTDDLMRLARLGDPGVPGTTPPRWGFALNLSIDNTIGYLYAFGGRVFDDQGNVTLGSDGRIGTRQWLNWLMTLNNDPQALVHPDSSTAVDRELKSKHVLMTFGWAHQLAEYNRLWGVQMGIAPLPRLSATNQPPRPYLQSDILVVNRRVSTAEQRVAMDFLHFMTSSTIQHILLASGMQPCRVDVAIDLAAPYGDAARVFRSQAAHATPMPNTTDRATVLAAMQIMQDGALSGRVSPDDALTEADTRLRQSLHLPQR